METSIVYIITYGDIVELVSGTVKACYEFFLFQVPEFQKIYIKSYSQIARDMQNAKVCRIEIPGRYSYVIRSYPLIKSYKKLVNDLQMDKTKIKQFSKI